METVEIRDSTFVVVLESCADAPDTERQRDCMEDKVDQLLHWFLQRKGFVTYNCCISDFNTHTHT